jgi:DNA repair protein RAD50
LDVKITETDAVLERLEQEHQVDDRELSGQISQAQRSSQELNVNVDKLGNFNRTIERYVHHSLSE